MLTAGDGACVTEVQKVSFQNGTSAKAMNEVSMLIIGCRDKIIIVLDPEKPKRGWSFPSAQVIDNADPCDVAIDAARKKIGFDASGKRVDFVKSKEKNGIPFSSYFVEVTPQELASIKNHGPRGHSIRKVPKESLGQYLDRGRYDMAIAKITGVATR